MTGEARTLSAGVGQAVKPDEGIALLNAVCEKRGLLQLLPRVSPA